MPQSLQECKQRDDTGSRTKDTTMKYTFFVKADSNFVSLLEDISQIAKELTVKKGVTVDFLKFAKRAALGYVFFKKKKSQEDLLNEIVQKSLEKYPGYTTAQIAELISELVNTTIKDAIITEGLRISPSIDAKVIVYGKMHLIQATQSSTYIPRHPWYMSFDDTNNSHWHAQNVTNNTIVAVKKEKKGNFYEYEIQQVTSVV